MEAEGFEPSSRETCDDGLYMLRRFFDLDADDENRHPSSASSRLYLAITPTSERESQPAFLSYPSADTLEYAEQPKLGCETDCGSVESDAADNTTVISSYVLLRFLARPTEHPGHATATVAIRSKPFAPDGSTCQRTSNCMSGRSGRQLYWLGHFASQATRLTCVTIEKPRPFRSF
jgi:hypothetical protein